MITGNGLAGKAIRLPFDGLQKIYNLMKKNDKVYMHLFHDSRTGAFRNLSHPFIHFHIPCVSIIAHHDPDIDRFVTAICSCRNFNYIIIRLKWIIRYGWHFPCLYFRPWKGVTVRKHQTELSRMSRKGQKKDSDDVVKTALKKCQDYETQLRKGTWQNGFEFSQTMG